MRVGSPPTHACKPGMHGQAAQGAPSATLAAALRVGEPAAPRAARRVVTPLPPTKAMLASTGCLTATRDRYVYKLAASPAWRMHQLGCMLYVKEHRCVGESQACPAGGAPAARGAASLTRNAKQKATPNTARMPLQKEGARNQAARPGTHHNTCQGPRGAPLATHTGKGGKGEVN